MPRYATAATGRTVVSRTGTTWPFALATSNRCQDPECNQLTPLRCPGCAELDGNDAAKGFYCKNADRDCMKKSPHV